MLNEWCRFALFSPESSFFNFLSLLLHPLNTAFLSFGVLFGYFGCIVVALVALILDPAIRLDTRCTCLPAVSVTEKPPAKMTPQTDAKPEEPISKTPEPDGAPLEEPPLENIQKSRWERSWPTIACGAGLFSDGYLNGVCALIFYLGIDGVRSYPALTILTGHRRGQYHAWRNLPGYLQQIPG